MSSDWKRHQGTVLALLKNCLAILDAAKYPQVATEALYLLSDVYLPASFVKTAEEDGSTADKTSSDEEENWGYAWEYEDDADDGEDRQFSVDVKALSTPQKIQDEEQGRMNGKQNRPSGVPESLEQRCSLALQTAVQALECILNE